MVYVFSKFIIGVAIMNIDTGRWIELTSDSHAALWAESDERLIEAVAAGDKGAMRVLYKRYNVFIYRFIKHLIGDCPLIEDIVSDVFLQVWRHAGQFEGRSKPSTWLLAISRYKALEALRRRDRKDRADRAAIAEFGQANPGCEQDPSDNGEDAVLREDAHALMRRCIDELSPEHREIIDLIYYQERTVDEVAQITRKPKNTVKTRAYYARKHLARLLAARNGFDRRTLFRAA
jgi:RNA polymerase sigma-70 factor, ECF subfamily